MTEPRYCEWPPAADLAAHVACIWNASIGDAGLPYTDRVLPDACVDVIWDGARLFIAGPDTGPELLVPYRHRTFVGLRMRPGRAAALLGCPASEVRDERPELAELWGRMRAGVLADRLAAAAGPRGVAAFLERALRGQLAGAPAPDAAVDGLVAALRARASRPSGLVKALAADIGLTERSLRRRCDTAVGYGPKTLERVLRFRRALALARPGAGLSLGALAAAAGYADQAHLSRECRRLAGLTPSELFKTSA